MFQYTESDTGYFLAFISFIAVVFASQMPRVIKILGANLTVCLGFFLFSIGLFLFSIAQSNPLLYVSAMAMGAGFGFTVPLLNHMTIEHSNAGNRGKNLSYYSIGIFGGQFLSSFIGMLSSNLTTIFMISGSMAIIISIVLFIKDKLSTRNTVSLQMNNSN